MVETQLCKLRGTSDTLIGRACAVSHCNMVFVNYIYDMVVDTQFHKFLLCRGRSRVFYGVYVFLMKDTGRRLPWVPPGSTGRFYKDDVVPVSYTHLTLPTIYSV